MSRTADHTLVADCAGAPRSALRARCAARSMLVATLVTTFAATLATPLVAIFAPFLLQDAALAAGPAASQETPGTSTSTGSTPASFSLPETLRALTDVYGWRTKLEQAGVKTAFTYYGDVFNNPWGGVYRGPGYDGRFGFIVDADLEKLMGWSGAKFHGSVHFIHGTQFSTINLQNLATVSGVEAPGSLRLFNLWIEQKIGDHWNVRFGQISAGQEFMVSQTAGLFVNAAFGWPILPGSDLPSASPAYPVSTPGFRLAWKPNDQFTVRAAIFDGSPAGPGSGNPVFRDPYGLSFRVNDQPLLIGEVVYAYNQDKTEEKEQPSQEGTGVQARQRTSAPAASNGLPGKIKLGAWWHTGLFPDQRFNSDGLLLAYYGGQAMQHRGDVALYGVFDQMLWRSGERELSAFVRAVATPSDRNSMTIYLDAGLTYQGLFDSRPDDTIGIAISYNRISPLASAYDRDTAIFTATAMPIRSYETAIELTYQVELADNWTVQPNLQYIIFPGGHVPNPNDPTGTTPIPNALVLGVRTSVRF